MRKRTNWVPATALLALGLAACTTPVARPAAPTVEADIQATETGGVRSQAVTIRATVQKVDAKSRRVSLLGFDGTRETITVGPEVKNLPQVRKGDEVVVTYYQAAAFDVLKKGETRPPASEGAALLAARPGTMPGGMAAEIKTVVVDVLKLDPEKATAVVRGPEGNSIPLDIRNPEVFEKVKVGDRVEITLAEAMAIDVRKAESR